jgi:hypothetical protein
MVVLKTKVVSPAPRVVSVAESVERDGSSTIDSIAGREICSKGKTLLIVMEWENVASDFAQC